MERHRYTGRRVTDEEREQARLDAEESADIPTRIDAQAIVFDPSLLAPPVVTEELRIGVADLDEDLRTMTQNNHEVERWRRLSTRGMERSPAAAADDEPVTEEQELPDVTDIQMRPLPRDAYRPPPMRPGADLDTGESSLEPSFTTSPGMLRSETTPLPTVPNRASRSFGAPREGGIMRPATATQQARRTARLIVRIVGLMMQVGIGRINVRIYTHQSQSNRQNNFLLV